MFRVEGAFPDAVVPANPRVFGPCPPGTVVKDRLGDEQDSVTRLEKSEAEIVVLGSGIPLARAKPLVESADGLESGAVHRHVASRERIDFEQPAVRDPVL